MLHIFNVLHIRVSIKHSMPIINITSLFFHLALPFILLMPNAIQNIASDAHIMWHARSTHPSCTLIFFIGVLLIATFIPFIEQWIQNNQESHVDYQDGNDPNYNNNNKLDYIGVARLIFAFTSLAKLRPFSLDMINNIRKNHWLTFTTKIRINYYLNDNSSMLVFTIGEVEHLQCVVFWSDDFLKYYLSL